MGLKRPGYFKPSFNSGEISAEAAGRTELKTYYSGARYMSRVEPVAQGGFDLMPGTRMVALVRGALQAVGDGYAMQFAPAPVGAGGVAATLDLGRQELCTLLDFFGIGAAAGTVLRVEARASTNGAWRAFSEFRVEPVPRNYRCGAEPGAPIMVRYIRLVVVAGAADVSLSSPAVRVWREGAPVTKARLFAFSLSREIVFQVVVSAGNADIYRAGKRVASIALPYTQAQIAGVRAEQREKTLLFFEQDTPPKKLLYQTDFDWLFGDQIFKNIPDVDLGGTYPKTADKWRLTAVLAATSAAQVDQSFLEITVNGETAETIQLVGATLSDTRRAEIAGEIKTKIEALADVEPGIVVINETPPRAYEYPFTIEFAGENNIGDAFQVSARINSSVSAVANTSRLVKADAGGEPLFSNSRGYPRDAEFWQQRLVMTGFKAKGSAILFSVLADYFNLNTEIISADGGVLAGLDTTSSDKIERVVAARHLLIFTSEGEYFVADRAVSRTAALNVVQSSRNGCAQDVPVVLADEAVFYMNRNNSILYASQYSDAAQAYESAPVSLLATHLVNMAVDAAFQRPKTGADAGRYLLVRADGILIVGSIMRGQEITGFVRYPTDGAVRAVGVDGAEDIFLLVERKVSGVARLVLERMEEGLLFDQALDIVLPAPSLVASGFDALEGAQVWAKLDEGYIEGPFTVVNGSFALPYAATRIQAGRWTAPMLETLPPNREIAPNTVLRRKARIHAVEVALMDTTSLAVGANGRPAKDVALDRLGNAVDVLFAGKTGFVRVAHCPGYLAEPTVVITQLKPGRLKVRDLTIEQGL